MYTGGPSAVELKHCNESSLFKSGDTYYAGDVDVARLATWQVSMQVRSMLTVQ